MSKLAESTFAVPMHGPVKWTKKETQRLLAAAERIGGTFNRRRADGTTTPISRATWFTAYVRLARATALLWSAISTARHGDITTGGVLVAKSAGSNRNPSAMAAFPLGKNTLAAIEKLRGEPSEAILDAVECSARRNRKIPDAIRKYFRRLLVAAKLADQSGYKLILGNMQRTKKIAALAAIESKPISAFSAESLLAEFVEQCYLPQKILVKSDSTRKQYAHAIKAFSESLGRPATVGDLTDENVCKMLRLLESRNLSPFIVLQRQTYISAIANWCSKRGLLSWWLALERYRVPEILPDAWTVEAMQRLLAACEATPGRYFDVRRSNWWLAFHYVLWDTGERTSAVLAIQPDWIDDTTRVLAIPAAFRKGGRKTGIYELKPQTMAYLRPLVAACRDANRECVFAFPGCQGSFYTHYTKLLKAAKLPSGRRNKPQKFRRTFATFIEAAGGNATEALRHSSRRITEESYIDRRMVRKPSPNLLLPSLAEKDGAT